MSYRFSALMVCALTVALLLTGCTSGSIAPPSTNAPTSAASTTPSVKTALTGCALVTAAEASAAVGVAFPAGTENPFTLTAKIVAHSGCAYKAGAPAVAYDVNTMAGTIPADQLSAQVWGVLISEGATASTFGGNTGIIFLKDPLQEAAFFRGQTIVTVSVVHGQDGAAVALANLIAARM